MKTILCTAILVLLAICPAAAQTSGILESVVLRTTDPQDIVRSLDFGFSPTYTDGVDCDARNECEIPAVPPQQFWVMFIDPVENFGLNKDIRGVPDSVASGARTSFALRFEIDITRYTSDSVIIAFPDAMTPGIDSVVVVDKITSGNAFRHVFINGNTQVMIPFGPGIRRVVMTVHYDLRRASAPPSIVASGRQAPLLFPNPARRGQTLSLRTPVPEGVRFEILNLLGERVSSTLETPQVAGAYVARIFGLRGELLATERVVVVP